VPPDGTPALRGAGAANELDVLAHDDELAARHGQALYRLTPVTFGAGRRAPAFGTSKINLHQRGRELLPHAACPTPGSADLCLVTEMPQAQVVARLAACGVPVEQGPVPRTGALGPFTSAYLRDPDGNLIEISTYPGPPQQRPDPPVSGRAERPPRPG